MDRPIVYPTEEVLAEDNLKTNRATMIGLGALVQTILGTGSIADGFTATPGTTGLSVTLSGGSLTYLSVVDSTAYGVLTADTRTLMRQAITLDANTLTVPSAGTWLISVSAVQSDSGDTVLPFVNAANPSEPFSGPGGTGGLLPTVRQDRAVLAITSGTTVPSGSYPLYVVTVPSGAAAVVSGDIAIATGAPFVVKLPFCAPLNSPNFTGSPTAPTAATGNSSTLLATTAFAQGVVAPEVTAREAADTALQGNINDEIATRAAADTALQGNINDEIATRAAADTAEATARAAEDNAIITWVEGGYVPDASFTGGPGYGWQGFYGGLIVQWGEIGLGTQLTTTLNFPTTFPGGCLTILVSKGQLISLYEEYAVGADSISNSQFNVSVSDSVAGEQGIHYFAIGY